jgi:DNA polymerase eta
MDSSEVNSRTQIKSMLSAKSFRPSINTAEQATRWLRIFVADIYSRLVDEGVLENKRRPKTMNLHHRQGGQTKSRQAPILQGRKIDEAMLFDLAKSLLGQIIMEGRVWPCSNLSLSVGGFEDGVVRNMGIGAFLVKGDEAKALNANSVIGEVGQDRSDKRRRLDSPAGIQKFFAKMGSPDEHDDDFGAHQLPGVNSILAEGEDADSRNHRRAAAIALSHENEAAERESNGDPPTDSSALHQQRITDFTCDRCIMPLESADALQSHQDWHLAKDLQNEDRGTPSRATKPSARSGNKKTAQSSNRKKSGQGKPEKGQMKLAFG